MCCGESLPASNLWESVWRGRGRGGQGWQIEQHAGSGRLREQADDVLVVRAWGDGRPFGGGSRGAMFARRAGLELYLATQKQSCKEVLTCKEENKFCLSLKFPPLQNAYHFPRPCKHIILASEPTSNENIWEEIPDGALVSIDSRLMLRLHEAPTPFWVTWPSLVRMLLLKASRS